MKGKKQPNTPDATIRGLHGQLKAIMARELEQLPATLEALPPQERIKAVIELLQYAAPKLKPEQAKQDAADVWELPTF